MQTREKDEWEELIESAPRPYERLGKRMVADPSAAWRDADAQRGIGLMLAFALGAEFELEKKLFRHAAAKLLSQCSGDVEGLHSVIQNLYCTSWLPWARKQNSPFALLNSIRRAWRREKFLAEPSNRRLVKNFISELADALDKPFGRVARSCLQEVIVLLEMHGEETFKKAFFEVLNSDFVKWMKTFNASPKAFFSRVREYLMFADSFEELERDWRLVE